jgi:hypothetical protein
MEVRLKFDPDSPWEVIGEALVLRTGGDVELSREEIEHARWTASKIDFERNLIRIGHPVDQRSVQ